MEVSNTKNMPEIKPCPFCGSSGILKKDPLWYGSHGYHGCYEIYVTCCSMNCGIVRHKFDTIYNSEQEAIVFAIRDWNERREPSPKHYHND